MEINIEMNFPSYMSRDGQSRGFRNAQCVPLRSKQWFIKSNLFEGGTRCEERKEKQQNNRTALWFSNVLFIFYICCWAAEAFALSY